MSNGTGPISLNAYDYDLIKTGLCITSGAYLGCIKVGTIHYWLSRGVGHWDLNTSSPPATRVKMVTDVWNQCKEGGTMTYYAKDGGWKDGLGTFYQWDGQPREDIELTRIA
jgi:hypothetical protein